LKTRVKISCKEATKLILKKEESKLSVWNRLQLYIHLLYCSFCNAFKKQNNWINLQIPHIHEYKVNNATDEFKARVLQSIESQDS
jgi:hypothetical protein